MNNKIKYILATILIISSIVAVSSAIRQPNDYIVKVWDINNIETNPTNNYEQNWTSQAAFIPLTASATYTLTVTPITATINITQPNQIQAKFKAAINAEAAKRGYNLIKIISLDYLVSNP